MSKRGEDPFDGGESDEEQEAGEEHDDGQAHPLRGGLVGGLGLGELVGAKRRRLGREAGADLRPFGARQRDRRGELGQLADTELFAEATDGGPGGLPGEAGLVEGPA